MTGREKGKAKPLTGRDSEKIETVTGRNKKSNQCLADTV